MTRCAGLGAASRVGSSRCERCRFVAQNIVVKGTYDGVEKDAFLKVSFGSTEQRRSEGIAVVARVVRCLIFAVSRALRSRDAAGQVC